MPDAASLFKRQFGYPPVHVLRAPLGLALIGQGAEVGDGLALTVPVNRGAHFASSPRADGKIELVCEGQAERASFWLNDLGPNEKAPWADSIKAVLGLLQRRGVHFTGFTGAIAFDPPLGLEGGGLVLAILSAVLSLRRLHPFGLSTSGTARALERQSGKEIQPLASDEKWHLAKLCALAAGESGATHGLVAAAASLAGKAWQVTSLDLRSQSLEFAPVSGAIVVLCRIVLAAGSAGKTAPNFAEGIDFRTHAECAARQLGVRSLRTVESRTLAANQAKLSPAEFAVVRYLVEENARVVAAERALRDNDLAQFGQYLFQSHEGLRGLAGGAAAEIDPLIELARVQPGCLGATVAPGCLGWASLNLVAHHQAPNFMKHMAEGFERLTGDKLAIDLCQIVDGGG